MRGGGSSLVAYALAAFGALSVANLAAWTLFQQAWQLDQLVGFIVPGAFRESAIEAACLAAVAWYARRCRGASLFAVALVAGFVSIYVSGVLTYVWAEVFFRKKIPSPADVQAVFAGGWSWPPLTAALGLGTGYALAVRRRGSVFAGLFLTLPPAVALVVFGIAWGLASQAASAALAYVVLGTVTLPLLERAVPRALERVGIHTREEDEVSPPS